MREFETQNLEAEPQLRNRVPNETESQPEPQPSCSHWTESKNHQSEPSSTKTNMTRQRPRPFYSNRVRRFFEEDPRTDDDFIRGIRDTFIVMIIAHMLTWVQEPLSEGIRMVRNTGARWLNTLDINLFTYMLRFPRLLRWITRIRYYFARRNAKSKMDKWIQTLRKAQKEEEQVRVACANSRRIQYLLQGLNENIQQESFQKESDNLEPVEVSEVLRQLVPSELSDYLLVSAVITSLTNFIISIAAVVKERTKMTVSLMTTSLLTLILLLLGYASKDYDISDDLMADVQQAIPTLSEELMKETNVSAEEKFEAECKMERAITPLAIKKVFKNKDRQFTLPPVEPPQMYMPNYVRPYKKILTVWSVEFLSNYWEIAPSCIERFKRMAKMISTKACLENIEKDNIIINKNDLEREADNEDEETSFKTLLYKLCVGIMYLGNCVITKTKFSLSSLLSCIKNADACEDMVSDASKLYAHLTGQQTEESPIVKEITRFTKEFNTILETPNYKFSKVPRELVSAREILKEFEKFYTSVMRKKNPPNTNLVYGLYIAVNKKITSYLANEMGAHLRQEPFVLCFLGKPGIGKTKLAKHLCKQFATNIIFEEPARAIAEITPTSKYWPPLAAQEIAYFDDSCTQRDITNDLLWGNMKGICSSAGFNAEGAAVEHKMNPLTFKIIVTTVNTEPSEIGQRVAAAYDATSWAAYCRRTIFINTKWNNTEQPDPDNGTLWDNDKFTHLKLSLMELKDGRLQETKSLSPERIFDMVKSRYARMEREFNIEWSSLFTQNEASASHFSVAIHGRAGQGKTHLINKVAKPLSTALQLPYYIATTFEEIPNSFSSRCIIVLDDVIKATITPEQEDILMDLYNSRLVSGSYIINISNVSPTSNIKPLILPTICRQRSLRFKNEGLIRRYGYKGWVNGAMVPSTNGLELFIENMRYFMFRSNLNIRITSLPAAFIFTSLLADIILFFIIGYPIFVFINFILWIVVKDTMEELKEEEVLQVLIDGYRYYLDSSSNIEIRYCDVLPDVSDATMEVECDDLNTFLRGNAYEIDRHIFMDKQCYVNHNHSWKIYCHPSAFRVMARNPDRFRVNGFNFNTTDIIGYIQRYSVAFNESEVSLKLKCKVVGSGEFVYSDKVLYIRNEQVEQDETFVTLVFDNGLKILFGDQFISVSDLLSDYHEATKHLSAQDLLTLGKFISSEKFCLDERVIQLRKESTKLYLSNLSMMTYKVVQDKFNNFKSSIFYYPFKILLALLTSVLVYKLMKGLYKSMKTENQKKKGSRKGNPKHKSYESDDDELQILVERTKGRRKGSPKKRSYESDDDKEKKKGTRKGSPKSRSYESDDDRMTKEDVNTLVRINDDVGHAARYSNVYRAARKNLCQVYMSSELDRYRPEKDSYPVCYGLFVGQNIMVTVGHLLDDEGYYCVKMDELEGYHKCELLMSYNNRDLAVFYVPTVKQAFPSLRKYFFSQKVLSEDYDYDAMFCRFAPKLENFDIYTKHEEFFFPSIAIQYTSTPMGGKPLGNYGVAMYASTIQKFTFPGDCGLPYFSLEPDQNLREKMFGIHCMGNKPNTQTAGVLSLIFQEDIDTWLLELSRKTKKNESWNDICQQDMEDQCKFCRERRINIQPALIPKANNHQIVWHQEHESTLARFIEEYNFFIKRNPAFLGSVLKHSGKLYGTVEHSHTQFIPLVDYVSEDYTPNTVIIKGTTIRKNLDVDLYKMVKDIPESSLESVISKLKIINPDFRLLIHRYYTKNGYQLRMVIISIKETQTELLKETQTKDIVTFKSTLGSPVYVPQAVGELLEGSVNNRKRGKQEDIPFINVPNNQTVVVRGSFCATKSHLPNNHYKLSPFSKIVKDLIPIEKKPCVYDITQIPEDELSKITIDLHGKHSQLATLSLHWAHPLYGNPLQAVEITAEFEKKIRAFYSNMRLLTDDEVLKGASEAKWRPYLGGMELDTSIGFTMKELFYVSKKSDVIGLTEEGKYYWKQNPASVFIQEQYRVAKQLASEGKKYCSIFTELLKMEKLKLSKIYRGRTFVAQDLLGVLMERYALGMFNARAFKLDPECGVGVNPTVDFDAILKRLQVHPNIWAGDYTNFDRNTPAFVMLEISKCLQKYNPHMANEIKSVFLSNVERIQVAGNTLFECYGGLPSGCFSTATLNSLNNEYLMYSSFHILCQQRQIEPSWEKYNANIVRYYYGDDVIVSVSDDFKDIFTRANVSIILKQEFGMTLGSSAKDGTDATFDTLETASWISRYFRQIGKMPWTVGALKKISIGANFHYVSSVDLSHIGSLMEKAMWEAAAWEPEYYNKLIKAIQLCLDECPALHKHVQIRLQSEIHKEIYYLAYPKACEKEEHTALPKELNNKPSCHVEERANLLNDNSETKQLDFFEKYRFESKYFKFVINKNKFNSEMAYVSKLNEVMQQGKITKPDYVFNRENNPFAKVQKWCCTMTTTTIEPTPVKQTFFGMGYSKSAAKEECAYECLVKMGIVRSLTLKNQLIQEALRNAQKEMNQPQLNDVNRPQILQQDVNLVQDATILTNTEIPSSFKLLNNRTVALDWPSASIAPYDLKTKLYNQYSEWTDKNMEISPALARGSEILRLSLDPKTWPSLLKDWAYDKHYEGIPELEIGVLIGGVSGTIGMVKFGIVGDSDQSKTYTTEDLQSIASETHGMNNGVLSKFLLRDSRKALFRSWDSDTEPYPAIVAIMESPVLNVQRNDAVNYPVRVYAKFGPGCYIFNPRPASAGPAPSISDFHLGSYMYNDQLDLLIGSSAIVNDLQTNGHGQGGFDVGDLNLAFNNVIAYHQQWTDNDNNVITNGVFGFVDSSTPSAKFLEGITNLSVQNSMLTGIPSVIYTGVGDTYCKLNYWSGNDIKTGITGTVYKIGKISTQLPNKVWYDCTTMYVQSKGAILEWKARQTVSKVNDLNCIIFTDTFKGKPLQGDFKSLYFGTTSVATIPIMYIDDTHDNITNAADFELLYMDLDGKMTGYSIGPQAFFKEAVMTGNNIPSSNLPTGLKTLSFVRQGTTTTLDGDTPFAVLTNPIIKNVYDGLDYILKKNNWSALKGNLNVDGFNLGEVGYQNRTFFVRTDLYKVMKPGITNDIVITDYTQLTNVQGLSAFNAKDYPSWVSKSARTIRRVIDLSRMQFESAIGAGIISGLGNGLGFWANQQFQQAFQERAIKAQMALQEANNLAIAKRQQDAFNRNLELTGYGSASMQHGQAGPTQQQYGKTGFNSFVYGGTYYPSGFMGNQERSASISSSSSEDSGPQLPTLDKAKEWDNLNQKPEPISSNPKEWVDTLKISNPTTKPLYDIEMDNMNTGASDALNYQTPVKSILNPNAKEFVPQQQVQSSLNPNVASFIPKEQQPEQQIIPTLYKPQIRQAKMVTQ